VTVDIAFRVQAHPTRTLMAETLAQEVGGQVCYDPEPDAPIKSPWRTLRHLLETRPQEATHVVSLQDDTTVCPGFRDAAHAAVEARSDRLILFFVAGRPETHARAVWAACERDEPWAELPAAHFLAQVAVAWPTVMIPSLLEFVDVQGWRPDFTADDEIVNRWARHVGVEPISTVPNLVQHEDRSISLIGRRTMNGLDEGRTSCCYVGDCDECDVAAIDWTR